MADLTQTPAPGERFVRFVGDSLSFRLAAADGSPWPAGWCAFLRTNLGRAEAMRTEILAAVETGQPRTLASWRDIPLERHGEAWTLTVPVTEVGYFRAKAYAVDPRGWQHWPPGPDVGVNVQPANARTANLIYCAFPRMFGATRTQVRTFDPALEAQWKTLDAQGHTFIPPSGKLRDLLRALPHIFDTLGCRILHLLPVNPTPTTYARFGRFGSPYACEDLLLIDPALVEFDRRTTGIEQFRELADGVHSRGGRLFLDMVVNHTGWGSTWQELHPEWFARAPDGRFISPGAWGVTWEDLVQLEHRHPDLRRQFGEVLVEWCRRGVDGFRCDAGYQVPLPVWQYVIARVRQEFPDTVFLLEGLGGSWEATEELLTEGGMQWAYSELFQNYSGLQVSGYLDHAHRQSARAGLLVHYSETHDNERLAARGPEWSRLRNRLCALTSVSGAFGFTCGVEWLAPERIQVHSSRGLAWDAPENLVGELARLNRLLSEHPCFFDGAELTRLSEPGAPVYALRRISASGSDAVLVLVNTDPERDQETLLPNPALAPIGLTPERWADLLGTERLEITPGKKGTHFKLPPAAAWCLAAASRPAGSRGEAYRRDQAGRALALEVLSRHVPIERLGGLDAERLGRWLMEAPASFLGAAASLNPATADLQRGLDEGRAHYPRVVRWNGSDRRRITLVPPGHWLLVEDRVRFRATLRIDGCPLAQYREALPVASGFIACFPPAPRAAHAELELRRYAPDEPVVKGALRLLGSGPSVVARGPDGITAGLVLLTNGIGGMARLAVDLGAIRSKYDCLLGANLNPRVPVDRHVFAKRVRVWVNAHGFLSPLNGEHVVAFEAGATAHWRFVAPAGDGWGVEIDLWIGMLPGRNTTVLRFRRGPDTRLAAAVPRGLGTVPNGLSPAIHGDGRVSLTVRVDLEDRNFHWETRRNADAEHHFQTHTRPFHGRSDAGTGGGSRTRPAAPEADAVGTEDRWAGFRFEPAPERVLRVWATAGEYHPAPEWSENIPHPVEQSRGQAGSGDAFSPGWFELPLAEGDEVGVVLCADATDPSDAEWRQSMPSPAGSATSADAPAEPSLDGRRADDDEFGRRLERAIDAFVVRREADQTVIAGYPWFLDWGRDTFVAARGLLAAGRIETVSSLLRWFGRFERHGTLPNSIHGEDASNRDTSDAPLWYGVVCEELASMAVCGNDVGSVRTAASGAALRVSAPYAMAVDAAGRTVADVLHSIAVGYLEGTPNGIKVDPASGLVWSPSHFTWMDTNYPAGTPRQGYPIEIQALWIRLLRQLDRLGSPPLREPWRALADRAQRALQDRFWLEDQGYYADVLSAGPGQPAATAEPDDALRSNFLWVIAFGLAPRERAQRGVDAALRHLVVPGGLRSLAPLAVRKPLPIRAPNGQLLNDPQHPYWGRYEGDEDTRRKLAYHNGTAWIWTFPTFCEALVRAWDFAPSAVAAARAYLGSVDELLATGCLGHLPEIVDGDAPHEQRGCDAQAWSVTEVLRVWRLLAGQ